MGTIKVMAFEPNRPSTVLSLPNTGEDIEDYIGGRMVTVSMSEDLVLICCQDNRKKKPNRDLAIVDQLDRHVVDTLMGNFILCRTDGDGLCDLNDESIARIKRWEIDGTLTMYRAHS